MKKNNSRYKHIYTFYNALFHFLVGLGFSVTIGYGNPILSSLGLNSSQIGIIFALSMFLGIIIQSGISVLIENYNLLTTIQSLRFEAIFSVILGILFILFKGNHILASITFIFSLSISTAGFPTLGALSIECLNANKYCNYGLSRSLGSIGYSALAFIGGIIITSYGYISLFKVFILVNIIITVLTFLYPNFESIKINNEEKGDTITSMLVNNKDFRTLIIGICLIFFSHNIINNFLKDIFVYINASTIQYGIAVGTSSFLEIPTLILFIFIIKRYNCLRLLKISSIFMTLKVLIIMLAISFTGVYLAQFTQPFAYALFTPAVIYCMNDIVKRCNQVKGQLMIGVASMGIGGGCGNLLGGTLITNFGVHKTLVIATIVSIIGSFLFFKIGRKKDI